jgi:cyclophilin family peptidyl-prolyl cis-trans isomerase
MTLRKYFLNAVLITNCLVLSACGGGGATTTSVTNLTATNATYGRSMSVSVTGSGLDRSDLKLEVSGASCPNSQRTGQLLSYQATFSCAVEGVGPISAAIKDGDGFEFGRVLLTVPVPQVTMSVAQGLVTGNILIELDPVAAPTTTLNFLRYVNSGFYNETIFHRVLAGRIAQGGQYTTGKTLRPTSFPPIKLESNNGLKNIRATIAMARTIIPDSATAQFYFNLIDNPAFDFVDAATPGYAVFGRVVGGMEVVDEIGTVATYTFTNELPSLPQRDVIIRAAVQTR